MNSDNFLIEEIDIQEAQKYCQTIENPITRQRAVANTLAANLVLKYFDSDYAVDTKTGVHNIPQVLNKLEISDIYINNNYIDVRLYFNENELCVPKSHFDNEILPVAYMFIKLDESVSAGIVTGFITPEAIDTTSPINGYYQLQETDLVSFFDIEPYLTEKEQADLPDDINLLIHNFLDNNLDNEKEFYNYLLSSSILRKELLKSAKARNIFKYISVAEPEIAPKYASSLNNIDDIQHVETLEEDNSLSFDVVEEDILLEESDDNVELLEVDSDESYTLNNFEEEETNSPLLTDEIVVENSIPEEKTQLIMEEEAEIVEEIELEEQAIDSFNEVSSNDDSEIEMLIYNDSTQEDDLGQEDDIYSTATTPSLNDLSNSLENKPEEGNNVNAEHHVDIENEENIDILFDKEDNSNDNSETNNVADYSSETNEYSTVNGPVYKNKKSSPLPFFGMIAILAGLGYFAYNHFVVEPQSSTLPNYPVENIQKRVPEQTQNTKTEEAMPNETIENIQNTSIEEDLGISIPAIEKNLDASIVVSNLRVSWEVPASYVSNSIAKRYLTKLGKIIQLNLKTELLLLSKAPITNKIAIELEMDKSKEKLTMKKMISSSGEVTIDDVIKKTVTKVLDMNLNINTSTLTTLKGNPVLVINL